MVSAGGGGGEGGGGGGGRDDVKGSAREKITYRPVGRTDRRAADFPHVRQPHVRGGASISLSLSVPSPNGILDRD